MTKAPLRDDTAVTQRPHRAPALRSSYLAWFPAESTSQESADHGTLGPVLEAQPGWTPWRASCVGQVVVVVDDPAEDTVAFAELLASADVAPPIPVEPDRDLAVLLHASVTTGPPSVARLTHRAVVAAVRQVEALAPVTPSERLICPIPFSHLADQMLEMNQTLPAGATVVILPRFDLESFLALIQQHRVTTVLTDPSIALALAAHPLVDRYDLSSLERILCATPLSRRWRSACTQRMGRLVGRGYREAETGVIVAVSPTAGAAPRPGSVRVLVPNTQACIVNPDTGIDVGAGATGELWVHGPQLMAGDLGNPTATAPALDGGWLRTSDLVRIDTDGWIVIVDRLTPMITRGDWASAQRQGCSPDWSTSTSSDGAR